MAVITREWPEAWRGMIVEGERIRREPYGTAYARNMTTEHLKLLWDRYDGSDDAIGDDEISGEAIHMVLCERGESSYCCI